jgi:oxygen-independent coproporphyrinogen-3 oxidase
MNGDRRSPLALYIHVPFCVRRCHYCDFAVTRSDEPPVNEWLTCLAQDLAEWSEELDAGGPLLLDTIFVGGGTPSLLGGAGMESLAELLAGHFEWDSDRLEWTAEANPGSLTAETARCWRELGLNRLSIGVQSFDDRALKWLGRLHDSAEANRAVERAHGAGFENVSVDLIFGLPRDVTRNWKQDLERATSLGVTHVSAYGLTAEPRTPLGRLVANGRVQMPSEDRYAGEYTTTVKVLNNHNLKQYEVSNFALDGFECRHNWHYWIGSEYLGLGPSAHSLVAGQRIWNVTRWQAYRDAVAAGASVREGRETPDRAGRRLESLWLGLRTRRGIDLAAHGIQADLVDQWVAAEWASISDGVLRLTAEGWLRLDGLVAELDSRLTESQDQNEQNVNLRIGRR